MPGIIVGVDGSAHSARALEFALKEGTLQNAPVTVLAVHGVLASPWTGHPVALSQDPAQLERLRQAAEEMTLKATGELDEARPPSVTVRAINGFPAKELIDASRDADLVVIGSRGTGGFARLMLGSVSDQVVHHAHCPVVEVPGER